MNFCRSARYFVLAIALLSCGVAFATSYNAVTDFSLTTNVASNTWSYWGTTNTNVVNYFSNVTLLPVLFNTTCGFGTSCWDASSGPANLILQNVTGSDGFFANSDARNGQLTFYTRSGIVDVRFLAPTAGTYNVAGFFEGSANTSETTTELIAVNGNATSPVFSMTAAVPFGSTNNFSFSVSLAAAGTIDFLVEGVSTTSDLNSLATGFDATITSGGTVPEPSTLSFLLLAGTPLAASLRKRMQR
jgi:hypothetical protein